MGNVRFCDRCGHLMAGRGAEVKVYQSGGGWEWAFIHPDCWEEMLEETPDTDDLPEQPWRWESFLSPLFRVVALVMFAGILVYLAGVAAGLIPAEPVGVSGAGGILLGGFAGRWTA